MPTFLTNHNVIVKCYGVTIARKVMDFLWKNGYNWASRPKTKQGAMQIVKEAFDRYPEGIYFDIYRSGVIFYQEVNDYASDTSLILTGTKFLREVREDVANNRLN